jgi:hypothetical protein
MHVTNLGPSHISVLSVLKLFTSDIPKKLYQQLEVTQFFRFLGCCAANALDHAEVTHVASSL